MSRRRAGRMEYADQIPLLARLMGDRGVGEPVGEPVQEARALQAAGFHRVVGYLAEGSEAGLIELSADARRRVAGQRLGETVKGRLLRREAEEVLPVLEAACGVAPVLIKGPAVADSVYPHPRLRPFRDLDFVVPAESLSDAVAALAEGFGYRRLQEPWPGYGERHGHHVALGREEGATTLVVELHWRITTDPSAKRLDHAFLARSDARMSLSATSPSATHVPVPDPAAQLLVLACHLMHEERKRLLWMNDLNLAARTASEEEWQAAFTEADGLGLTWVLHRALDYPKRHLELDRPRPSAAGAPPPWGPFRANEALNGWLAWQVGQLSLGGWTGEDGYLRSALRARRRRVHAQLRGHGARRREESRPGSGD